MIEKVLQDPNSTMIGSGVELGVQDVLVPTGSRFYDATNRIAAFVLLALAVVFSFCEIYSEDLGFHLRAGEWILQNLKFPGKDVFTYTASTHDYVDMYWLYQVVLSIINTFGGEFGLVASNALLIAASFLIVLIRIGRQRKLADTSNWQFLLLIAVMAIAFQFGIRPHVLSWIFLNVLLLVLDDFSRGRGNQLYLLPVVMVLWTNTHTLFILGWIVVGSYAVGMAWREKKLWTPVTKYALLSIAVSFVNPYFAKGVWMPFYQFQFLQRYNVFKSVITEYVSPLNVSSYFYNGHFYLFQPLLGFHIFFVLSAVSFLRRLRRITLQDLLIYGFFLYIGINAVKNIGYFVFAVLPATVEGLQSVGTLPGDAVPGNFFVRWAKSVWAWWNSARPQAVVNILTVGAAIVLSLAIVTDAYYINFRSNYRFGYHFNNYIVPTKAASFLRENKLDARIVNHFSFGGFLIYAIPQQVFIDGRNEVMGESLVTAYFRYWVPVDKKPLLDEYNPKIVIFPYQNAFLWVHYFTKDTTWRLSYVDELAAVYLKNGYAENILSFNTKDLLTGYERIDTSRIDSILRRPYPTAPSFYLLKKWYFPQKEIELSTFYYYDDDFYAAIQIGLNGLLRSNVPCPEAYYNLGHYFFQVKDYARAAYCYQRFLETNFDDLASDRLTEMRSKSK